MDLNDTVEDDRSVKIVAKEEKVEEEIPINQTVKKPRKKKTMSDKAVKQLAEAREKRLKKTRANKKRREKIVKQLQKQVDTVLKQSDLKIFEIINDNKVVDEEPAQVKTPAAEEAIYDDTGEQLGETLYNQKQNDFDNEKNLEIAELKEAIRQLQEQMGSMVPKQQERGVAKNENQGIVFL